MRMLHPSMGAAWLALLLGGCATTSSGPVPDPAAVRRYTCFIQVEGIVAGGAIKLDGSQVSTFPGWVSVEVDESGLAVRRYVVSLSTNIIGGDLSPYVIEQGGEVPMKIFYERTGPVGTGTALVQGRH